MCGIARRATLRESVVEKRKALPNTMSTRPVKLFVLFWALLAAPGNFGRGLRLNQSSALENGNQATAGGSAKVVHAAIKNVDFHLTDRIVVHISALEGNLLPTQSGQIPIMDDKRSFQFDVDSANVTLSAAALSNDLNDYVFAQAGAPLKKLKASIKGGQLIVHGVLAKKGGIPFETDGTVSVTPDGLIRVHTVKVKAVGVPVKGLMDLLGIETDDLLNTKKVQGVTVDKDDLILDPEEILPPPRIHGHLAGIQLRNEEIALQFNSGRASETHAGVSNACGGRNFLSFKGGAVRFGKLTMNDADLELVDSGPADAFDFSLDHYKDQLAAGYAKTTRQEGLCAYVPDFHKLKQPVQEGSK